MLSSRQHTMSPVRPLPALQCTTITASGAERSHSVASVQKLRISSREGVCHGAGTNSSMDAMMTELVILPLQVMNVRDAVHEAGETHMFDRRTAAA